jgi:selenocysteine lyase/cysteine desulfurase
VRHAFASLINASDEEVGLLSSTSEGENVVTDALDLKRGENVVIDDPRECPVVLPAATSCF